jgi:hypothetical protein
VVGGLGMIVNGWLLFVVFGTMVNDWCMTFQRPMVDGLRWIAKITLAFGG